MAEITNSCSVAILLKFPIGYVLLCHVTQGAELCKNHHMARRQESLKAGKQESRKALKLGGCEARS
jgi:hypothetical protein